MLTFDTFSPRLIPIPDRKTSCSLDFPHFGRRLETWARSDRVVRVDDDAMGTLAEEQQ
jgi:hypothetical protein